MRSPGHGNKTSSLDFSPAVVCTHPLPPHTVPDSTAALLLTQNITRDRMKTIHHEHHKKIISGVYVYKQHVCTFGLLHRQFITDLFLVCGEMLQSLSHEPGLPQNLILIKQQLAVLIIHLIRGCLKKHT